MRLADPATGKVFHKAPKGSPDDMRMAIDAATRANKTSEWADLTATARAE